MWLLILLPLFSGLPTSHTHPIPTWKHFQTENCSSGSLFQRVSSQVPTSPLRKLCLLFYREWKLPNWATMPRQFLHIPKWKQCLWWTETVSLKEKKKKIRGEKDNKLASLMMWKPRQSRAGCNNHCGPDALNTAVSSLPPAPTSCCSPPRSLCAIPVPSREIKKKKAIREAAGHYT